MTPTAPIPGTFAPNPPQPPNSYPTSIDALDQYKIFSRASAKAAGLTDIFMPPFDHTRPIKNWLALDVDDTQVNYFETYQTVVTGAVRQLVIPARWVPSIVTQPGQASTLNLPDDAVTYPPYEIAPVGVFENDGGNELPVNNTYFCTEAQAHEMAALIGVPNAVITEYQPAPGTSGYAYVYAAGETRRYYVFEDAAGNQQRAGTLLWQMNVLGVGRPGKFVLDANGWEWVPAVIPAPAPVAGPIMEMPRRALLSGESIKMVQLPTIPMLFGQTS